MKPATSWLIIFSTFLKKGCKRRKHVPQQKEQGGIPWRGENRNAPIMVH
jgi:hypothetical protein